MSACYFRCGATPHGYVDMGTLGGFPNPPAMVRGEQSSPAPHATIFMGTLGGFPNPPAMVRGERSSPAPHATSEAEAAGKAEAKVVDLDGFRKMKREGV